MKKQVLTFDEAYDETIKVNKLFNKGCELEEIHDMLNKKLFELAYNNGALKIKQVIMVSEDGTFYGRDSIDRLVVGTFIDKKYIAFCILQHDKKIAKFIGYNCGDYINIKFDGIDINTELDMRPIYDKSLEIQYLYQFIKHKLEDYGEAVQEYIKEIDELKNNESGYPNIVYKLNPSSDIPEIKKLTF